MPLVSRVWIFLSSQHGWRRLRRDARRALRRGARESCPCLTAAGILAHSEHMSLSDSWTARPAAINRQNAAEAVFEDLRGAIESGELSLGTRLPSEAALAERYGVSRPIVREALRSAQTLGLTQTRTGSGTFVIATAPSPEITYGAYSARDLMEARPVIEVPAAGWAARRRTDEQLRVLTELCAEMKRGEGSGQVGFIGLPLPLRHRRSIRQCGLHQGRSRRPRRIGHPIAADQSRGTPSTRFESRAPTHRRRNRLRFVRRLTRGDARSSSTCRARHVEDFQARQLNGLDHLRFARRSG